MEKNELIRIIQEEGDYQEFDYQGLHCIIRRVRPMCHLCGYAQIPKQLLDKKDDWFEEKIEVHGGVTFVGDLPVEEGKKIKFVGFDCAHIDDLVPQMFIQMGMRLYDETYKTMDFCVNECKYMAKQLLRFCEALS